MWSFILAFDDSKITKIEKNEAGEEVEILVNKNLELSYQLSLEFMEKHDLLPKKPEDMEMSEWVGGKFEEALGGYIQKAPGTKKTSGTIMMDIPDHLAQEYLILLEKEGIRGLIHKDFNRSDIRKAAAFQRKEESWNRGLERIRKARGQKPKELVNTAPQPVTDVGNIIDRGLKLGTDNKELS